MTVSPTAAGSLMFDDPANPGFPLGGWQGAHSWSPGKTGEPGSDSTVAPIIIENVVSPRLLFVFCLPLRWSWCHLRKK